MDPNLTKPEGLGQWCLNTTTPTHTPPNVNPPVTPDLHQLAPSIACPVDPSVNYPQPEHGWIDWSRYLNSLKKEGTAPPQEPLALPATNENESSLKEEAMVQSQEGSPANESENKECLPANENDDNQTIGIGGIETTLPQGLRCIEITNGDKVTKSVWTTTVLPKETTFGPLPDANQAGAKTSSSSGMVNSDNSWMMLIYISTSSRKTRLQNLVAYRHHGQIYFRALCDVQPGMELIVGYCHCGVFHEDFSDIPMMSDSDHHEEAEDIPVNEPANDPQSEPEPEPEVKPEPKPGKPNNQPKLKVKPRRPKKLKVKEVSEEEVVPSENDNEDEDYKEEEEEEEEEEEPRKRQTRSKSKRATRLKTRNVNKESLGNGHKCEKCDSVFSSVQGMKRHMRTVHLDQNPFACEECGKTFVVMSYLKRHMISHMTVKPHACSVCGKAFAIKKHLEDHEERHKPLKERTKRFRKFKRLECKYCGKLVYGKSVLETHERKHTGETPFSCSKCGKSFSQLNFLRNHLKYHAANDRRIAQVGSADGKIEPQLPPNTLPPELAATLPPVDRPKQRRPKSSPCDICGAIVVNIRKHLKTHSTEKAFKCPTCPKTFSEKSSLDLHLRTHSGEKPYICPVCDRGFSGRSNLRAHMQRHTGDRPYQCSYCGKRFGQNARLLIHIRIHTGERPFSCKTCGKNFKSAAQVRRHAVTHSDARPFSCTTCGKSFKKSDVLKEHLLIHSGERPFTCPHCHKGFTQRSTRQKHMQGCIGEPLKPGGKSRNHSQHQDQNPVSMPPQQAPALPQPIMSMLTQQPPITMSSLTDPPPQMVMMMAPRPPMTMSPLAHQQQQIAMMPQYPGHNTGPSPHMNH